MTSKFFNSPTTNSIPFLLRSPDLLRKFYFLFHFLFLITFFHSSLLFAEGTDPNSMSDLTGDFKIASNYVDYGLTQSTGNSSILANFGFISGGGKLAFEVATVKFKDEEIDLKYGAFGQYRFVFTPNADITIRSEVNRYSPDQTRSKIRTSLDQNFFTYHIYLMHEDNFEGHKKIRNWFGFGKTWDLFQSTRAEVRLGYSMVDGFDPFYDVMAGMTYFTTKLNATLAVTGISNSAQFGDQGKTAASLIITIKF